MISWRSLSLWRYTLHLSYPPQKLEARVGVSRLSATPLTVAILPIAKLAMGRRDGDRQRGSAHAILCAMVRVREQAVRSRNSWRNQAVLLYRYAGVLRCMRWSRRLCGSEQETV